MREPFKPGRAGRIDPIGISGGRTGRDKAVGRKQDNSVECLEIRCLFPPGATVVSYKMLILLESRVIMCGKHLAMCIDIYACTFGLFQQVLNVSQVVPTDKYTRVLSYADIHFRNFRVAIGGSIRFI